MSSSPKWVTFSCLQDILNVTYNVSYPSHTLLAQQHAKALDGFGQVVK